MKLPTDRQVDELFDRLKAHGRPRKPDDRPAIREVATLGELHLALLVALRRERSSARDGLDCTGVPVAEVPARALDVTRGQGTLVAEDENGFVDAVPATSVEIAAIGGLEREPAYDELHEDCEQACGYLVDAVHALGALQARLDHIARRSVATSREPGFATGTCTACGGLVTGGPNDRLKRGLGPSCYTAWLRQGKPQRDEFVQFARSRPDDACSP